MAVWRCSCTACALSLIHIYLAVTPRPGHADYTAEVKYGGYQDRAGGGHFSGRLTAPLCIAGGICLQILAREGITLVGRIASIAGISDEGELTGSLAGKEFPVVSDARGEEDVYKRQVCTCSSF